MPLVHGTGRKAFDENFAETKINSKTGQPRSIAQRLAIGYAERRRSERLPGKRPTLGVK